MSELRAVTTAVDFSDLLRITLPYNRHHFSEVMVVTAPGDPCVEIAQRYNCRVFETDAWWSEEADFNKWAALEEALDAYGRHGWICHLDADVLWPREADWRSHAREGYLLTPLRRMLVDLEEVTGYQGVPNEADWSRWPLHRNRGEWAGYSQIFHASDSHLPDPPPWHQTGWKHAGGADSFFQALWPRERRVRPPWEVLHLGPAGVNWCGRASPYLGGGQHPDALTRKTQLRNYHLGRKGKGTGVYDPARYRHEQLD